jgi:hypothetical protein
VSAHRLPTGTAPMGGSAASGPPRSRTPRLLSALRFQAEAEPCSVDDP